MRRVLVGSDEMMAACPDWFQPYTRITLRNGFIEEISLPILQWWHPGKALAQKWPLVEVCITDRDPDFENSRINSHWTYWPDEEWLAKVKTYPYRRVLPKSIWNHLQHTCPAGETEARQHLSRACLKWARESITVP